ncbi:hypothetical protein AMS68_004020 [Peltaster fructicola]|uniref:UNC-45/Cro1/She4 central domain-containing protein n=1 Tax=Peltaster fructicola TaxID=286661 RepID=A0A6H0XUU2_9PEZI|nr:hypothetical protein AMS68_004020 [Peltaster fructicola]
MSQNVTNDRVESLLVAADEQTQHGKPRDALQSLREASSLDPGNERVQEALSKLQLSSAAEDNVLQLLKQYESLSSEQVLAKLLQSLSRKNAVSEGDAAQCLTTALQNDTSREPWSDIVVRLINGQARVRHAVAQRITTDPDSVLKLLLQSSDDASKAAYQVLFDDGAWSDKKTQLSSQQAVYKKLSALEGSTMGVRRSTELMLRQLILSPAAVADASGETVFKRLIALFDAHEPQQLRGQALLATTKLLEVKPDEAESIFVGLVVSYAASANANEQVLAFSAVAALFPVIPAVCAKLVLTEGFVPGLVPLLHSPRVTEVATDSTSMQRAILDLLSAACIDKTCRATISKHCQTSLTDLASQGAQELRLPAALTLTKVSGDKIDSAVVKALIEAVLHDPPNRSLAIEGLAYSSLKPSVKEQMTKNAALRTRLIAALGQHTLSVLTIMDNLTGYRPARSEEQKKMSQLKAYANSSKPVPDDPLDNNGMVSARCKILLDMGVISALVASLKELRSFATLSLATKVINSIAREQKHRTRIVQEGGLKLLLQIDARLESVQHKDSALARRTVAHALARVLISVNPELIFNSALPATSAVSIIVPLLKLDQEQEERDLLPTFEALLALTNLASMSDGAACDLILRRSWETLEDQLLLSTNSLIQRASTELVCNLMLSPSGVAKFADGSDQAARRLHILLALADVDDLATRRAAGGALAMLTEWDTAVAAIVRISRGVKILLSMCADTHDDIRHRGIICVLNCISIPGDVGITATEKVKAENGITTAIAALA